MIYVTILLVVIAIVFTERTAEIDYDLISRGVKISDHSEELQQRSMIGLAVFVLNPMLGIMFGLVFWALFDAILSRKRGLPTFYIGKNADSDKFFSKHRWAYVLSKFLALWLATACIFLAHITWESIFDFVINLV